EAATRIGPAVSTICDHIHRHDGEAGVRRMLGVLSLAKKHGPAVIEDVARAALELGVPTYRFLRRYLERRPPVPLTLKQVDPLIPQLTLYPDLIHRTLDPQSISSNPIGRSGTSGSRACPPSWKRGSDRRRPRRWRPSIWCRRSWPTNSAAGRTACSNAGTSSRASVTRSARSIPLISISTRR